MQNDRRLFAVGRAFLAIAIVGFGVLYLLYGRFIGGLVLAQDWTPSVPPLAYVFGIVLVAAGILMLIPKAAARAALWVGFVFVAGVVLFNFGHVDLLFASGGDRTRALEPLAIGAASLVLAAALREDRSRTGALDRTGRFLFAFCLFIFGFQHFESFAFIASLIPSWIPLHPAFVFITGTGFIAAGVAIGTGVLARFGAWFLGLMFFLWVLVLHGPLVATHIVNGFQWGSLFVALAMCGSGWILASTDTKEEDPRERVRI
jgi:uncharacterized membrane protein